MISGTMALLVGRDFFVLSRDVKNIFNHDGVFRNIFTRAQHALKAEKFVDSLLENTYMICFLRGKILQELQKDLEEAPGTI